MRGSPVPPSSVTPQNTAPAPTSISHMSPVVGGPGNVVMSPHPNSGPTESRSNSMHNPGYPPGAPSHMTSGPPGPHGFPSKMGHMQPGAPYGQPGYQQTPGAGHQYPGSRPHLMQQYPQGYPNGPQGPPGHQFPPRPPHNSHVPPGQPYPYSHYNQQGWPQGMGQQMMSSAIPGKGGPSQLTPGQNAPGPPPPGSNSIGVQRPHYLKQHIQHKMGPYSVPPGPQMYPNGPGLPPGVPNSRETPPNSMPPPTSTPQPQAEHDQPGHLNQGPPLSGQTTVSNSTTPPSLNNVSPALNNNSISNPPQIGPDGMPIVDEASQHSTVSNTSVASGEDRSGTPKPHKDSLMAGLPSMARGVGEMMSGPGGHSGPLGAAPLNSAHSPGTASMTSQQDEFETVNSPGWPPRSPSGPPPLPAPVAPIYQNSQPPPPAPEVYRPVKPSESVMRLYDMSDIPERRAWLDRLLRFMEDNKTPITACPTISKNPLDLYSLYLHVRDRGGFEEVTKNKHWKDVAAVMGIGASSSGSYTLRRHYMKHILAFECKFDRGGVDPAPIIAQIESTQKKKSNKSMSVPSPGSNSSSMDGFSNGPHMPGGPPGIPGHYPGQYPPSSDISGHMQHRPPGQPGYQGYQGSQYPGYQSMHGGYGQPGYPNSGYAADGRGYPPGHPPQGSFAGYQQPGSYQRPGFPPPSQQRYQQEQYPMSGSGGSSASAANFGGSQLAKQLLNPPPPRPPSAPSGPVVQGYQYPPKAGAASPSPQQPPNSVFQGPRRHPDFDKAQPGWRPASSQFASYGSQGPPPSMAGQQPWPTPADSGAPSGPGAGAPPQWSQPRYPPPSQAFPNQARWSSGGFGSSGSGPRASVGACKLSSAQATSFKGVGFGAYMGKQLFPMDSVEAVSPVLVKRKRLARPDVAPVDPWKLFMSLRCGLASEVTWALDVLNILLFDDQTVVYFGLMHMPGLLDALIEHFRRGLINMFNICSELEHGRDDEAPGANKRIKAEHHDYDDREWFAEAPRSPSLELDLGRLEEEEISAEDKETVLRGADYSLVSRAGTAVRVASKEDSVFLRDGIRDWDKWEGFDSGVDTWSVGGGECTAHIICSMRSSVSALPFTRLIPGCPGDEESPTRPGHQSDHPRPADADPTSAQRVSPPLEIPPGELVDSNPPKTNAENGASFSPSSSSPDRRLPPESRPRADNRPAENAAAESNDANNAASAVSEAAERACNGPVEATTKQSDALKSALSSLKSRKNNFKTSKLDAIVNRIKKEPCDVSKPNIFNKFNQNLSDSKSILDHYLKNDTSNDCDKQPETLEAVDSKSALAETESVVVKREPSPAGEMNGQDDIDHDKNLLSIVDTKSPIRSPLKLPSIVVSPVKGGSDDSKRESACFKRPYENLESESWCPDEASLVISTEGQDWLAKRVIVIGTIVRNLSFVPGNEDVMSKSASLLALLGKTIALHHDHPTRDPSTAHYDRDDDADFGDWCSSLAADTHWWWPYLHHIHENTLVTVANVAGHLDLSYYPEEISRPILDGLLHWVTCPASYGRDPLPGSGVGPQSSLSPRKLALEALVKFCVLDSNTDLVLATPPFSRLDLLCGQLTRLLCRGEEQVTREFAINLFHYFSAADSGVARVIAMQNGCVSHLLSFIEEAENAALSVASQQGVSALKENPELMGTSLDMVRRSANTLVNLSRVPDNARILAACEARLLSLVMSQILDTYVASQLSQVLFNVAQCQRDWSPPPSPPVSPTPLEQPPATDPAAEEESGDLVSGPSPRLPDSEDDAAKKDYAEPPSVKQADRTPVPAADRDSSPVKEIGAVKGLPSDTAPASSRASSPLSSASPLSFASHPSASSSPAQHDTHKQPIHAPVPLDAPQQPIPASQTL